MERNSSSSLIISFLKTHFKGDLPINWPNDCCLLYFPCHHVKQAGLDHAKIHVCLGSKDASTQTEPHETSAEDVASENEHMIGSLFDNKNIALSHLDIKQEPDTSFELEKANWQVLGIPGNTNHMFFTQQHPLVLHQSIETLHNAQVTGSLLGFRKTKAVEDDGTRDHVRKKDSISREEEEEESIATSQKPNKTIDSGNKPVGKEGDIITATLRTHAKKPSNAESWLRSGGKKLGQVSDDSLAGMWKRAKQEMDEESDKPVKRRGRPKKQNKADVPLRVKRKHVRHKPISECKHSKKHKKGKIHNNKVDMEAQGLEDNEDKKRMDVDDPMNGDRKDEATQKKQTTKAKYAEEVYIDILDLSRYYTFVKGLSIKGEDGYRCDVCNLTLIGPEKDKKRIERHIIIHSEGKRTHKCDICGKLYSQKQYLRKHMLSHSNIRPFKCPVCSYAAKRKDHVRNHIRQWHSIGPDQYADKDGKPVTLDELGYGHLHLQVKPNEEGLYTCPECDATFNNNKDLKKHVQNTHRAKSAESGQGIQALVTVNYLYCKTRTIGSC